ncbi:hypothetical protein B9Z55_011156 [Caenorhabditis nigoni]|uniref:Sdz-33 F-box domain-containing protein n=1 Tax=Caenorhabditis nigoni TaxID=1611254 RepID=A0A2G5UJG8_9PELO|nr:hypothetical protein B9Z55_011156 [Caenorhabditis nigoni]
MSLCDLNRFFKLWMKGSNPKLKNFTIHWRPEIIPEWKVLLKGLNAKDAEVEVREGSKKFVIQNCRGIRAEIELDDSEETTSIEFTVSD